MAHVWTEEDEAYMEKWYKKKRLTEVAADLGVSVGALRSRAQRRGLLRGSRGRPKKLQLNRATRWTQLMSDILDEGLRLADAGYTVECRTRWVGPSNGGHGEMAYFAGKE